MSDNGESFRSRKFIERMNEWNVNVYYTILCRPAAKLVGRAHADLAKVLLLIFIYFLIQNIHHETAKSRKDIVKMLCKDAPEKLVDYTSCSTL